MHAFAVLVALVVVQKPAEKSLQRLLDEIVPRGDDVKWRTLPWRPTLWEGLAAARREGKPVLLWAMNGHPLGCT